jgi:hypothetical protein
MLKKTVKLLLFGILVAIPAFVQGKRYGISLGISFQVACSLKSDSEDCQNRAARVRFWNVPADPEPIDLSELGLWGVDRSQPLPAPPPDSKGI